LDIYTLGISPPPIASSSEPKVTTGGDFLVGGWNRFLHSAKSLDSSYFFRSRKIIPPILLIGWIKTVSIFLLKVSPIYIMTPVSKAHPTSTLLPLPAPFRTFTLSSHTRHTRPQLNPCPPPENASKYGRASPAKFHKAFFSCSKWRIFKKCYICFFPKFMDQAPLPTPSLHAVSLHLCT
jgi:hypothetical protein